MEESNWVVAGQSIGCTLPTEQAPLILGSEETAVCNWLTSVKSVNFTCGTQYSQGSCCCYTEEASSFMTKTKANEMEGGELGVCKAPWKESTLLAASRGSGGQRAPLRSLGKKAFAKPGHSVGKGQLWGPVTHGTYISHGGMRAAAIPVTSHGCCHSWLKA